MAQNPEHRNRAPRLAVAAVSLVLVTAGFGARATADSLAAAEPFDSQCAAPAAVTMLAEPLQRTAMLVREGQPIKIVAIGSSSTQGFAATSAERTYPRQLARLLSRRLGGIPVEVVNKGIGGQLAANMLERFERDVLSEYPALVIWQTGTNDMVRSVPITEFRAQIADGIERLKAAGIDVIVMSPQYYPRVENASNFQSYIDSMQALAGSHRVSLFCRYTVMREWAVRRNGDFERTLASDRFHMSDAGYYCLAKLLAEGIVRNVARRFVADVRWHGDPSR